MQQPKFHKISWGKYYKDTLQLGKKLKKVKINLIVAISRGGLVAARILSDILNLSISHISIASYQDLKQKKKILISETPSRRFDNQTVLLVDEIADSGKTFGMAKKYFLRFKNCRLLTLALYIKSKTKPRPDFWAQKIDAWVIFPYELAETYQAFKKIFNTKAIAKMKEVGFEGWETRYLR